LRTVLDWYIQHDLDVAPINPSTPTILQLPVLTDLGKLQDPLHTSVSVITPPEISLKTVEIAAGLGINMLWFQPGSFNDVVLKACTDKNMPFIANGHCILIEGDQALHVSKRSAKA
jgi:predicted CoA-binding protein